MVLKGCLRRHKSCCEIAPHAVHAVIASEAKQSRDLSFPGLLRHFVPRNDGTVQSGFDDNDKGDISFDDLVKSDTGFDRRLLHKPPY